MSRLAPFCMACLLICAPALAAAPAPRLGFYLIDNGTLPGPAVLSIAVQTELHFSCVGYELPTTVRVSGSVIDVRVGEVKPPAGDVCATALAPAHGTASLGALAAGSYRLRLMQRGAVDAYVITVKSDSTELTPNQGKFSTSFFQSCYRVPAGSAHVSCIFGLDARCAEQARRGSPTCETLFADPEVAALPPLESRPGPFSQSWFNENGRRFAAPAFEQLRPIVSGKRYHDSEGCLFITVHSGRGESFNNRTP